MKVPFHSFSSVPIALREQWREAHDDAVESGYFIGGPLVKDFETAWAHRLGVAGCVGVGNGLDALTLALRALGIGSGHSVAVPAHTFIATWLSVLAVGAQPVGVDVGRDGQMDLDLLESSGQVFDAIIPVHMHGMTVDMPRLMRWANSRQILVLEDCAQAHGATIDGTPVGSWGHAAAFSFYPTKNLGAAGDAGAVVSDDLQLLDCVRSLANYGAARENKYVHESIGVNSRLDPMQAAILSVNVEHLVTWNRRRQEIAQFYLNEFASIDNVRTIAVSSATSSVWHHFILIVENPDLMARRLSDLGVGTDRHYPRLAADEIATLINAPVDESSFLEGRSFARHGLSIPLNQWMSDTEVEYVAAALKQSVA